MTKQPTTVSRTIKRRRRLRVIEDLYLSGFGPAEIHDKVGEEYGISYGMIRNDVVAIRKAWGKDIDDLERLEGTHRYLASCRQLRRKAIVGRAGPKGERVGIDLKLVHSLDQEIARLSGVRMGIDEKTLHLDVRAARDFIDQLMVIVFDIVEDEDKCERIVASLSDYAAEGEPGE